MKDLRRRPYGDMVTPGSYFIIEDGLGDVKRTWGNSQYAGHGGPLGRPPSIPQGAVGLQDRLRQGAVHPHANSLGFLRRSA